METVPCAICGEIDTTPYQTLQDRFSGDRFQLVRCANCGLIYLNPRPTPAEIGRYYPQRYEPHRQEGGLAAWHQRKMRQMQLDFVQRYHPQPGRLLDIGCATGEFLVTAREGGWQVAGIEMMPDAARTARTEYQLTVTTGAVESVDLPAGSYDVITMWDVLEHLFAPMEVIARCHKALKPGGWLIFAIPNLRSFDRYLFRDAWVGWEAPRHLYFFTPQTLDDCLQPRGFERQPGVCLAGGKGVFQISMETRWRGRWLWPVWKKGRPLWQAMLWPYRQLSYLLQRGTVITYAAQKRAADAAEQDGGHVG